MLVTRTIITALNIHQGIYLPHQIPLSDHSKEYIQFVYVTTLFFLVILVCYSSKPVVPES